MVNDTHDFGSKLEDKMVRDRHTETRLPERRGWETKKSPVYLIHEIPVRHFHRVDPEIGYGSNHSFVCNEGESFPKPRIIPELFNSRPSGVTVTPLRHFLHTSYTSNESRRKKDRIWSVWVLGNVERGNGVVWTRKFSRTLNLRF